MQLLQLFLCKLFQQTSNMLKGQFGKIGDKKNKHLIYIKETQNTTSSNSKLVLVGNGHLWSSFGGRFGLIIIFQQPTDISESPKVKSFQSNPVQLFFF